MAKAAIFIPSNRKLAESVEPIWSAIRYAQERGMSVVISDNSGDPEKHEYFSAAPTHVIYLPNGPAVGAENGLRAINATDADFVTMLGDDDNIAVNTGHSAFDFSTVPDDVAGIKPRIEVVGAGGELISTNTFTIDATDPAARVIEYTRKMGGGNTSFYCFFRRDAFQSILDVFAKQHPTGAGNVDFAMVYALVAGGRIIHDPSTVLRYNNANWDGQASAEQSMKGIFSSAGLPETAGLYLLLFHFIDSYVLMFRASSRLPPVERYKSAYAVAMVFLKRLIYRIRESPFLYDDISDLVAPLTEAVESADPDLNRIFHVAGLIADRVKPGLKQQYDRYLLTVSKGV